MKKFLEIIGVFSFAGLLSANLSAQTAGVLLRPLYVDTASAVSRSAVLMNLSAYPSSEARFRLFRGSSQYQCWDALNNQYITSTSYASGPSAPGNLIVSSTFWIPYQRGNNNSSNATYRDRLGPDYIVNFRDAVLPAATGIVTPFSLSGTLLPHEDFNLLTKYIVLLFSEGNFISGTHSDTTTGTFTAVVPTGISIDKIEVRTLLNDPVVQLTGEWSSVTDLGNIQMGVVTSVRENTASQTGVEVIRIFPVPTTGIINVQSQLEVRMIEVLNMSGVVVEAHRYFEDGWFEIDISAHPAGIYFVRIHVPGQVIFKKLIKL